MDPGSRGTPPARPQPLLLPRHMPVPSPNDHGHSPRPILQLSSLRLRAARGLSRATASPGFQLHIYPLLCTESDLKVMEPEGPVSSCYEQSQGQGRC